MTGLLAELRGKAWAMERRRLEAFLQRLAVLETHDRAAAAAAPIAPEAPQAQYEVRDGVALIPVLGIILKTVPWYYEYLEIDATATGDVRASLDAAMADPNVSSVLLVVDSPGGIIDGVQELADAIYAARGRKPLRAHASDLAASAAYWLASQADSLTANETAELGSIGVYTVYWDTSKAADEMGLKVHLVASGPDKGVGVPGVPISDEQLEPIREVVNEMAATFVAAVARGRAMAPEAVADLATGRTWTARPAVELGLLDDVQNFDTVLASVGEPAGPATLKGEGIMPEQDKAPEAPAQKVDAEAIRMKAREEAAATAVADLKAMEAAFPADGAFARAQWEQGKSVEQARGAHYAVVTVQLADAAAKLAAKETELAAKDEELEALKAAARGAGAAPVPTEPTGDAPPAADGTTAPAPVATYQAKVKELLDAGDKAPERTVAVKFPAIHAAYLDAVNAPPAPGAG